MDKRYQVFISSTFADLEEERKEIMQAIIELDCFPAGMEMFPATDSEQFEYIKTIINESDYYVLIVAGRYGSVAEDGISYTEKEFDFAKEKEIPILAFVKKDINSITVGKTDQDPEKLKKLEVFRKRVLDGRMANFWDTADELKYKIHSSLSKQFKTHPRIGWVKGNSIPSYEVLEQLSKLQEENKQLIIDLEEISKNNTFKDQSVYIMNTFTVHCEMAYTMDILSRDISIQEVVNKTGLSLSKGVWLDEFEDIINKKVISLTDATITNESLEEIVKRLLALGIIELKAVREETHLKFTDYGNKVFIKSIEL
ncbi:DUF4062 domain-containing protein [Lacrimispora sp.]|uniref:DUF4062 domain-containing protein n=1 Tax=Lacrimispora sp. TaxID=2719234 RepID=UPI002FDAF0BB